MHKRYVSYRINMAQEEKGKVEGKEEGVKVEWFFCLYLEWSCEAGDLLDAIGRIGEGLLVLSLALWLFGEEMIDFAGKFLLGLFELCVVFLVVFEFVHAVNYLLGHQKVLVLAKKRKLQGL